MSKTKIFATAALALAGTLAVSMAHANDRGDVQWSVTIGTPVYQPVYTQPAPVYYLPQYNHYPHYRQPTRWDRDGDGIPNGQDRFDNRRFDRDGDGIPNRYDHH